MNPHSFYYFMNALGYDHGMENPTEFLIQIFRE